MLRKPSTIGITEVNGFKAQRLNLDKELAYLRAGFYEPFSLVTARKQRNGGTSSGRAKPIVRYKGSCNVLSI